VALQGTIETFALPDVLRLLASSKKTGRLRVSGTRGSGSVWVDSGQIVQTDAARAPHALSNVDVVFELLRYRDGSFTFENDRHAPDPGSPQEVEPVLIESELQLAEWREIEAIIPSIDCTVRLVPELPRADVVVDAEKWRVLVAIGGGTSVSQVGDSLILGEMAVSRAVRDLVELGVVEVLEPSSSSAPVLERRATEPIELAEPDPDPDPDPEPIVVMDEDEDLAVVPEPRTPIDEVDEQMAEPVAFADHALHDHGRHEHDHHDDDDDEPVGRSARAELDALTSGFGFEDPRNGGNGGNGAGAPTGTPATSPSAAYDFGAFDRSSNDGAGNVGGEYDALGPTPFGRGADDLFSAGKGAGDSLFAEPEVGSPDPLFAEPARPGPPPPPPPPPGSSGATDASEVARQLANLSPKAARAVAAAARAGSDEEREAYLSEAEDDGGVNRSLLLKFLSTPQD